MNLFLSSFLLLVSKLRILRVERKLHKIARAKALFPFPFIPHHPPQKREMFKGVGISITLKGGET